MPFLDAVEAGLWLFWVCEKEIVAVPRPAIQTQGDRLHCADGPAISWPGSRLKFYYWRGVQVPSWLILKPEKITGRKVLKEKNAELRRVMVERIGYDRLMAQLNAKRVQADDYGELYYIPLTDDEPVVLVKVENSTAEPDGTFKSYILRVPPTIKRARDAVAWTFDVPPAEYAPVAQT